MRKNEMNALTYAQITTWICLSLTTTFAWSLTERRALLFDAVCLFALAWGILLPFYSSRPTSWSVDLPAFSCFMLLLFGTQLRHAASIQRTGKQPDAPALIQKTGLSIVAIIALRLSIPHMEFLSESTQQSLRPYLYPGLNSILFISAYILIWYGVTDFFKGGPNFNLVRSIVGFVALAYIGADIAYTGWNFFAYYTNRPSEMPDAFLWLFGTLKVLFTTAVLVALLCVEHPNKTFPQRLPVEWVTLAWRKLFGN
jgi:hypothetical protein